MMGAQRDRQSNRAFKLASDSVRLWFFFLSYSCAVWEGRAEHSCSYLSFYHPLLHHCSPHWAPVWAILGSWWILVVCKMAEKSGSSPLLIFVSSYSLATAAKDRCRFKDEVYFVQYYIFRPPTPIRPSIPTILFVVTRPAISDSITSLSARLVGQS